MWCSKCGSENPAGAKFCSECATPMAAKCPSCGASNNPGAKFCNQCASPLAAPDSKAKGQPGEEIAGERRHLTVLFCDLVNSTEIAARLDPEEWRDIAAQYQRSAGEAVTRLGGHVAKYLGDGLVVYFGYPQAHEDDAERAVRGGLAIVDAIAPLNDRLAGEQSAVRLAVRVGIHTGSVVVGQGGGKEADVFGDAPNIASRVQGVAEPDTVVITAPVHQLVSGLFVVEDRGAHALKGIEFPMQLYRAIQPSVVRRRTRGPAARALTPFVGRDDEMRLLLSRWERACDGEGQLVIVAGEGGIGKSRLVEEFRERIKPIPHLWIECAGEQFFENTPFHAVTQMLNQGLGWRGDESKEERVIQIERSLELSGMKLAETVPLIAEMLNLPIPEKYPPVLLAPDQKRKRLLAALAGWVFGATRTQPLVLALEDLHWVDPSTLELQHTLVEQAATARLMLLFTARPEFRASWLMRAHHAQITLNRLSDRQTREMVAGVAARSALAKEMIDTVVKRTDGVPLFAEELTRLILEGDGRSVAREIPATLHDSLTARLDRLGSAKEVAQVAAVIGREFFYELLQAVLPMPEAELQSALAKLADAELIYARGIPPEATYQFKHALIQDAAYEALLKTRRKELHRRVARTITEKFTALAEAQPEVLARHWTGAGEAEPAIAAWQKAGEAADARGALKEAEENFRQALAMLSTLPASPERDARELAIVAVLSWLLVRIKGYSATETIEVTERARALAEKTGNLLQLILQVTGTYAAVFVLGDYSGAAALADQLLDLAQREGSNIGLIIAHVAQVNVRFDRGDLVGLEEHFARLGSLLEAAERGQFPGPIANGIVTSMGYASLGAWMLGHPEEASRRSAQAIAFAHDYKNPFVLAGARSLDGYLHRWFREPQPAADAAAEAVAISEQHSFSFSGDSSRIILGWARAQLGNPAEGVALVRQGLAGLAKAGGRTDITNGLTILAEAQALDGAVDDALITLDEALQANPQELVFRPNILKWRGELRLRIGQTEPAEADFREAIALAQNMRAKGWELRASTSLARLLAKHGKRDEARVMLADIYNWFTEGFDTADLKDAKALLEEWRA
jgi:class 3 adenylate cyclase/tetratricopeptide (TPR) repeat protein